MALKLTLHDALLQKSISSKALVDIFLKPPAWTRLEPQSLSGNPGPGIAACISDPLWLIGRQWQMGEFHGEDCGTPVSVRLSAETQRLSALRQGDAARGNAPAALAEGATFEPEIEAEPWAPPSLRDSAEAAAALIASLEPLGWSDKATLLAACAFDVNAADIAAQRPDATWLMIARHLPDAEAAALGLEAGTPAWMAGASAEVQEAAKGWLGWYRRNVSRRSRAADSWHAERLEYRFALQAGEGGNARRLEAPRHSGGPFDWHSLDLASGAGLGVAAADAKVETHEVHVHATRLRYAGMPADRMWQFEDGLVNFGVTEVQPNDLARLAFLEFATIYGNDWLIAPIDLPRGVLARVTGVSYLTTFGETIDVAPASNQGRRGSFALFSTTGPNGIEACFVIPPNGRAALEGPAREEVVFARDETANVVWAVERSVEGADGLARDRSLEEPALPLPAKPQAGADYAWTLETLPPDYWIPMVPVPKGGAGGFFLRKGTFEKEDQARGRMLAPKPFDLFDEEVPREGVRLRRTPSLLRDEHGRLTRWIARRVTTAWGEARSRLAYDATRRE